MELLKLDFLVVLKTEVVELNYENSLYCI